jgi:hypothetical protein
MRTSSQQDCQQADRARRGVCALLRAPVLLALATALAASLVSGHAAQRAAADTVSVSARSAAAAGVLTVPRLAGGGVPVEVVGTSGGAISVPGDAGHLGWWRGSRPFKASRGSSIVVGHVTDESDAPGAFYRLGSLRKGDRIVWTLGKTRKVFKVVAKTFTPRSGSLPDRIWQKGGARMIHLVSCARRQVFEDGGYHYTHNVTVSAKLVKSIPARAS